MMLKKQNKRGTILIIVSIIIALLSILVMNYVTENITLKNFSMSVYSKDFSEILAQSAIDKALYDLAYNSETFSIPEDGRYIVWTKSGCEYLPGDTEEDTIINNYQVDFTTSNGEKKGRFVIYGKLKDGTDNYGIITAVGIFNRTKKKVKLLVYNDSYSIHPLYYKAIYGGGKEGVPQTFELTGKTYFDLIGFMNSIPGIRELWGFYTNRWNIVKGKADKESTPWWLKMIYSLNDMAMSNLLLFLDQRDRIKGDIHIQGNIKFSLDGYKNLENNKITVMKSDEVSGSMYRVDEIGNIIQTYSGEEYEDYIEPPTLSLSNYTKPSRAYYSWDPNTHASGHDVVWVNKEFEHYKSTGQAERVWIFQEGDYFYQGNYPEWNEKATALPKNTVADFFMEGFQNHFVDTYTPEDDNRIKATKNFYLAQNGSRIPHGEPIIISREQNNKIYYIDGNLWIDSDGNNLVRFIPGEGVDKVNITILVRGNIYVCDKVYSVDRYWDPDQNKYVLNYPDSSVVFIAMADGESYNDINKNGKYDEGEDIIGRQEDGTPNPAQNNPSPDGAYVTGYRGRMEGSGNIIYGDTIAGPVGVVEGFLYADNNFTDITADKRCQQVNYVYGNMTAGNYLFLNRNYNMWEPIINDSGLVNKTESELINAGWKRLNQEELYKPYLKNIRNDLFQYFFGEDINLQSLFRKGPKRWRDVLYPPGTTEENKNNPFITTRKAVKIWNKYIILSRLHSPLLVDLDERIKTGKINPPGLPHSVEEHKGCWKPVMWINK